jgi:hypothetical protein
VHHQPIAHQQAVVVVVLEDGAPGISVGQGEQVAADHRMGGLDPEQVQRRRHQVDLARHLLVAPRRETRREDQPGDVEPRHRDQPVAAHAGVVVGGHHPHGVLVVVGLPGQAEQQAERVIGVLHRVAPRGGLGVVELDAARRVVERRVVRGGEDEREEGSVAVGGEDLVRLAHQVFVRHAPGAVEVGGLPVGLVEGALEAVAEHEGRHVVEVALAAVHEVGGVAVLAEQRRHGEEARLRPRELHHRVGRSRQEAGERGLDASHPCGCRSRTGA